MSNLVRIAAICRGVSPEAVAAEIGDRGAAALKRLTADALNERLRPIRARRAELAGERDHLRAVKELMHTRY